MTIIFIVGALLTVVLVGLVGAAAVIRRRQRALDAQREASQLQRRADHLFKIALAAQVHTRNDAIARTLLEEAVRVLEYSARLDPNAELTAKSLRECRELLASIETAPELTAEPTTHDSILEFPETELMEAQLHLTEAIRLLIGLEKRSQIDYDTLSHMTASLKQAQRAIDLRLQLQRAARALDEDRNTPKFEARTGEYLAALERSRASSSQ